ncbi:MAG: HAD family hydrolase [Candidatus Rokubacteria bacterium]|nr:HAD family hydrolase [Candidatus Rokubacteria bacterium]
MTRAVFLDRDGVINEVLLRDGRPLAPSSVGEVRLRPGVAEAIGRLRRAGFLIVVVTNQPDVGKGLVRREAVEAIHEALRRQLPLDDLKVCYHVDADGCACRKPKPGLLLEAARERAIDLGQSVMVGDRWRDIAAGRAAGCRTVLVRASYDERPAERPDAVVDSLSEASAWILSGRSAVVSHAEVSR